MPAAKLGRGTFINIGKESTYGVAGSITVSARIASETLKREQERAQSTHLSTSAAAFAFDTFDGMEICGGDVELPVYYNGTGILLNAAVGSSSTSASGSLQLHTYTPDDSLPSLTIELQRGNNTSEKFKGCIVSTMSLSIEAGQQMSGSFTFIAQTADTRTSAVSSTFNTANKKVNHFEAGTLSYNGNTYNIRSMNFNLDNKVERRDLLGSKLTAEPAITDLREVTLECTADYEDDNLYNSQLAGDISDAVIHFTNSDGFIFSIYIKAAQLISYNDDISTVGRVERTFQFQGFADAGGSHEAFKIEITNNNSGAEDN